MKVKPADQESAGGDGAKKAALAMPVCAALVDEMRAAWGVDVVNRMLAASQQARRTHAALVESSGRAAADAWLKRQKWPHGRVWFQEAGREIGVKTCG